MGTWAFAQRGVFVSIAVLAGAGAVEAADLVVINSNAPGIAKGAVIDDAKPISVPAGSRVSLVSATGAVVTINGPFDGPPSQRAGGGGGDGRLVASLATLLQGHASDQTQLGAHRGGGEEPDQPFQLNTSKSADFCVPAGTTVKLWRPAGRKEQIGRARIKSLETGGLQKEFTWAVGEMEVAWPAGVPVKDGGAYLISSSDMPQPARVIIHIMPPGVAPGPAQAAWMADNGCVDQALLALAAVQ